MVLMLAPFPGAVWVAILMASLVAVGLAASRVYARHFNQDEAYQDLEQRIRHPWRYRLAAPKRWWR